MAMPESVESRVEFVGFENVNLFFAVNCGEKWNRGNWFDS